MTAHPTELRLYNSLTRQVEPFEPLEPGKVKMYVCGPTVYDAPHLGHARCYITWDVLFRFLRFCGFEVHYARNITDVDDKILKRAKERGIHPDEVARQNTEVFHGMMAALNVDSPTEEPHATRYVDAMISFVKDLLEKGLAYTTESGTVYYETLKKADYGKLCRQNLDELQTGARVDVDPEKRHPLDFALWKPAPLGEPDVWDTPWGPGRPGWHLECSTMIGEIFGPQIDIHAGGADLVFPHHENEIAQSESRTGHTPFVRVWMHNGFVNVSGEKMSKSLGNFETIADLLASYDANTIRYFILTNHYRMPVDFTAEALDGAKNRIQKLYRNVAERLAEHGGNAETLLTHGKLIANASTDPMVAAWRAAMQEDLNTAQALAQINALISQPATERDAFCAFMYLASVMGFDFVTPPEGPSIDHLKDPLAQLISELGNGPGANGSNPAELVDVLIGMRKQAREERQWALSDQIRDRLADIGIRLMDRKDGPTEWDYVG